MVRCMPQQFDSGRTPGCREAGDYHGATTAYSSVQPETFYTGARRFKRRILPPCPFLPLHLRNVPRHPSPRDTVHYTHLSPAHAHPTPPPPQRSMRRSRWFTSPTTSCLPTAAHTRTMAYTPFAHHAYTHTATAVTPPTTCCTFRTLPQLAHVLPVLRRFPSFAGTSFSCCSDRFVYGTARNMNFCTPWLRCPAIPFLHFFAGFFMFCAYPCTRSVGHILAYTPPRVPPIRTTFAHATTHTHATGGKSTARGILLRAAWLSTFTPFGLIFFHYTLNGCCALPIPLPDTCPLCAFGSYHIHAAFPPTFLIL